MSNKQQVRALIQGQRWVEAKVLCTQICQVAPGDAETWFLLGALNGQLGVFVEAETSFRQAIALRPDFSEAHYNLGIALRDQGRLRESVEHLQTAIRLRPGFVPAYSDLGFALLDLNEPEKAAEAYRAGLQYTPDAAEAHANLGGALHLSGAYEEAAACFHRALQTNPGNANFHDHLATIRCCQGKLQDALASHREALRLKPNEAKYYSNYLLTLHYDPEQKARSLFTEHRRWGGLHARLAVVPDAYANEAEPSRRLRIGYVSADFRNHSVAYFFEPLLSGHDPAVVETFCYSAVRHPDAVTHRLEAMAHHWRSISGMTDADVFDVVQEDGIDILIDLAGHTAGNRLGVFAQKPAPLQITWLGYPSTTGLPTMDYRFTDTWADPPGVSEQFHTEALVRLPHGFLCYRPSADVAPTALPAVETAGHVTFGSCNELARINEVMISRWAEILNAVPESRLIISNDALADVPTREHYYGLFEAAGIDRNRLDLQDIPRDNAGRLNLYNRVDIALDTFPYNDTITTCEALWMGVPVVTLAGQTHAGRVGVSLLSQVGLHECIAENPDRYREIAVHLANDRQKLGGWRGSLRDRMRRSSLCDTTGFARDVEAAYRTIWSEWCSRQQEQ